MKRLRHIFHGQSKRAGDRTRSNGARRGFRVLLAFLGLAGLTGVNFLVFSDTDGSGAGAEVPVRRQPKAWAGGLPVPRGVPWVPICEIQGRGFSSPYEGQVVRSGGLVVADLDTTSEKAFYLQAPDCDADPASSDGLLVYLDVRMDVVRSGDQVEVEGLVQEYFGQTELVVSPEGVAILTPGNPLPPPGELDPPFDNGLARAYFEAREGMLVGL